MFNHEFLNPRRYVPPTNPTRDLNISPVIGDLFEATKPMPKHILVGLLPEYLVSYIKYYSSNDIIVPAESSH